ncbi:MAG TPA: hypothetical protein VHK24_15420, partial [Steroidobacter sp.]|nr:hypothetical protein [Steroidobacter sp.]
PSRRVHDGTLIMMQAPPEEQLAHSGPDAALLMTVQRANQVQVIRTLLHDLRNPVHSMRITVELFRRVAEAPPPDLPGLLSRAARYVEPAETALIALSRCTEQLAVYLGPPAPPAPRPVPVNSWLEEIAALLREPTLGLDVGVSSGLGRETGVLADRPRLSHAFLRWCLDSSEGDLSLSASQNALGVHLSAIRTVRPDPDGRLTSAELALLLTRAGGRVESASETDVAAIFPAANFQT